MPVVITSARAGVPRTLRTSMRDHAAHAAAMRDAVARADLDAARREAKHLASLRMEGEVEPSLRSSGVSMSAAVSRLAEAKDLHQASNLLGLVAVSCGDCHAMLGGPQPIVGEPPEKTADVVPRMRRHDWASARLWDGLVGPSEDAWQAGARTLADAPLAPERLTPGKSPVPAIGELSRSVREIARKARVSESPVDRGAIYGELVATCSACHERTRATP